MRYTKTRVGSLIIGIVVLIYILLLVVSRNPLIVDDVHPSLNCWSVISKADILFITPKLDNISIENATKWCSKIRQRNKTIGLHGIDHSYHEFKGSIGNLEITKAKSLVEACTNQTPTIFRPPYNAISQENEKLIEKSDMQVYKQRYLLHPYCHCEPKSATMKFLNNIIFC